MNRIDIIIDYLNQEGISGTKIVYGSCIESHSNTKDVDICVITNQVVDDAFYERYRRFLMEHNLVLDEDIRYEDKLLLSDSRIATALEQYSHQVETFDLERDYRDVVDRLIVNILTTKVKVYDDDGSYETYSRQAWAKVLERFQSLGGKTFTDFSKLFHITKDYKRYWGYAPSVSKDIHNRFYQHHSESDFIRLLKTNVINHPRKIAVYSDTKNLTYEELDELSDKVAASLFAFESDYVVVNYAHRYELLPIIFGILKAGKVYVPVDHSSPIKAINRIRQKFPSSVYISETDSDLDIPRIFATKHKLVDYKQHQLAYIIHTSGTTGTPKGVCVTTQNLNYIMRACQSFAPVSKDDCYLFSTRTTFDVSITEIFGFLYHGGSVYLYSVSNKAFYKELPRLIHDFGITHVALSPSVLGVLLKYNDALGRQYIDELKYLLIAGEAFKYELLELVEETLEKVTVFNVYGPTETTVYATYFNVREMSAFFRSKREVPIGRPLPGVETLILDNELLIAGQGVADGYYHDVAQTKAKFTKINGKVFYHTGDIVEESDSLLMYKGRQDSQIQLYGIRLELGEIRTSVAKIVNDSKRDIEVIFDNHMLILCYTGSKIDNLRDILEKEMISYKIPSKYINVPEFPLTPSGKVDKRALLEKASGADRRRDEGSKIQVIVQSSVESIMHQCVKPDDNLLDMGLNSLNSVELLLALEDKVNMSLDGLNLYANASVAAITSFIENHQSSPDATSDEIAEQQLDLQNILLIRDVDYHYPTFFYARIYQTLQFDSQLTGRIYLGKHHISYEEIYHKLSKIEVFRSVLSQDLNYFEVLDTPINISKYDVDDARIDIFEDLRRLVRLSKQHNGLLYKFVLLEDDTEAVLHYSIDHSICDSYSLGVLEKYLLGIISTSRPYSSYIREVYSRNNRETLLKAVERFDVQDDEQVSTVLAQLDDTVTFKTLDYLTAETKSVYVEILLFLRQHFLKPYHLGQVKVNLIYNIRQFQGDLDFTSTIGDLHLGLTYNLNGNDDIEDTLEAVIEAYRKDMFNPKAIGYKHFPRIDSEEEKLVKCFDDTVFVSVDYLGVISRKAFEKVKQAASETANEINKLNGRKLNVTAYIVDNRLELILSKAFH
ncbi:non-ribosomal peptide synthetase [Streptococcus sp. zg-JUN1979]|uniref:non-ribosomal peptide synthetase n=1 Tax=Streptococcus sp. zg-JUN1979 TaxID=3391450 RepID=UPI0039AEE73A